MPRSILSAILVLFVSSASAEELSLWVAPLEGARSLDEAWTAGAVVRDVFPDAILVDDEASAQQLVAAGFPIEGPIAVTPGRTVTLLRPLSPTHAPIDATAVGELPGVEVLWMRGPNAIVQSDGPLPPADPVRDLGKKVLAAGPMRPGRTATLPAPRLRASFNSVVDGIAAQVDSAAYFPWIRRLAGGVPVEVGGQPVSFTTRYTYAAQCDTAEQYVYEQFVEMGFPLVEYDEFLGGDARNVIATLPGAETPEQIYIVCGHLDSTSPVPYLTARGGNDNASGTAAVLTAAEILRQYTFRSTLKFIAFTGEEQGLYGSDHYASEAAAAGDDIRGVVNCDMIAWYDTQWRVNIQGRTWADPFMQVMNDACATYTNLTTNLQYSAWGSDHVPFLNNGFPSFLAIESEFGSYPCYHETCDTANRNKGEFGAEVARASIVTIAHLAEVVGLTPTTSPTPGPSPVSLEVRPNPFRASTEIRYEVSTAGPVELAIYDVSGRRVRSFGSRIAGEGLHLESWNGTDDSGRPSPAGIYFLRLKAAGGSDVRRVVRTR